MERIVQYLEGKRPVERMCRWPDIVSSDVRGFGGGSQINEVGRWQGTVARFVQNGYALEKAIE